MQINKKIDNTFGSTLITTKNKIVLEVLSICFHAYAEMQLVQNKKTYNFSFCALLSSKSK